MIAHAIILLEGLMPTSWFCFFSFFFNLQVMTAVLLFLLWLIGHSINLIRQGIQCGLVFWIPLRGFRVPGTLYWIPDLCQWNLDSGFQSSVGFWIPNPRIPGFFPPPLPPPQKTNFVDSLTWGDLMFKEVLKCLRADRTKHVIGRAHIRRVALLLLNRC